MKDLLKENMTIEEVRKIIRNELARIFFDLYRKSSDFFTYFKKIFFL